MADYYPLIARAIAGLEQNTGENRRALYERARTALVSQLRGTTPALNEGDITRERLALEGAIRKIESEASRRVRGDDNGERAAEPPPRPAPPPLKPAGPSLSDQGLKGFREVVAEAEGLGNAAAEASKSARDTFNTIPEDERVQPYLRREPRVDTEPPPAEDELPPSPEVTPSGEPTYSYEPPEQLAEEQDAQTAQPPDEPPVERIEPDTLDEPLPDTPASESEAYRATLPGRSGAEDWPPHKGDDAYAPPRRSYAGVIRAALIVLLVAGVGALGYWQRGNIMSMFASMKSSPQQTQQTPTQRPPAAGQPKITDRVGGDGRSSATAPAADVAQKVVLYDEDPNDPQGKRYVGSAIWRTETVSPGPGLAPELAIRADIEIPERRIRMTWSLRRNSDKALPASHTIEIVFTLPADFPEGGINNIPGVLMKQSEQTRGVPLAGLSVKVTSGFFLIGLSSVEVDTQRNIDLLKQRSWFDIPVVYNSNKRGILAVEKGTPGERVFEEAFRAWGQ